MELRVRRRGAASAVAAAARPAARTDTGDRSATRAASRRDPAERRAAASLGPLLRRPRRRGARRGRPLGAARRRVVVLRRGAWIPGVVLLVLRVLRRVLALLFERPVDGVLRLLRQPVLQLLEDDLVL